MENQTEELLKKKIRSNQIKIVADIFLIMILLAIGLYLYFNIEEFKTLGKDVCRLCEAKTGGFCSMPIGSILE